MRRSFPRYGWWAVERELLTRYSQEPIALAPGSTSSMISLAGAA